MTNCNKTLIEDIMTQIRAEVEEMCGERDFESDTLDDTEQSARHFAQKCGVIFFETQLKRLLEAQNSGHIGNTIVLPNGDIATFERYEGRWIRTHLGRHRFERAYYWNPAANGGVLPLDEKWNLDEREPSPSLRTSIGMLGAEMPFKRGKALNETGRHD